MDALKIYKSDYNDTNFVSVKEDFASNTTANEFENDFTDYSVLETLDYWPHQVIIITLYSFIGVVAFILNTITIAVLVKCDKSISTELHLYLINLSISDIVMSLFWYVSLQLSSIFCTQQVT